ncbi:MAG: BlaI/MecI/CopY family transcriptional regulator, partial [Phycisphaerae bacterium]
SRARAARQALNNVLGVFFDHSVSDALAAHLTDPSTDLSQDELDRLQNLIEKARREEKES